MLILLWLACADPEFGPVSKALDHYDRGHSALEKGDLEGAAEFFARAAKEDPGRPGLRGWQAWALDQAGDTQRALEVLDAALVDNPGAAELRYNRAALRSRTGKLAAAAADLEWLYANDVVQPVEVGEDKDFLPLSTHTEYRNLVPTAQVQADLRGESGSVLLGERYTLELTVVARLGARVEVVNMGDHTGLLRHIRTVENAKPDGPLWVRREVRIVYETVVAGEKVLGPWLIKSGGTSALTDRVDVEVVTLPGRTANGAPSEATAVRLPSTMDAAAPAPWIGIEDELRVARLGPRHTISPAVAEPAGPVYELWASGQVQWRQVPLGAGPHRVLEGGKVVISAD